MGFQLVLSLSIRGFLLPPNANGQDQHDHHHECGNFRVAASRDRAAGLLGLTADLTQRVLEVVEIQNVHCAARNVGALVGLCHRTVRGHARCDLDEGESPGVAGLWIDRQELHAEAHARFGVLGHFVVERVRRSHPELCPHVPAALDVEGAVRFDADAAVLVVEGVGGLVDHDEDLALLGFLRGVLASVVQLDGAVAVLGRGHDQVAAIHGRDAGLSAAANDFLVLRSDDFGGGASARLDVEVGGLEVGEAAVDAEQTVVLAVHDAAVVAQAFAGHAIQLSAVTLFSAFDHVVAAVGRVRFQHAVFIAAVAVLAVAVVAFFSGIHDVVAADFGRRTLALRSVIGAVGVAAKCAASETEALTGLLVEIVAVAFLIGIDGAVATRCAAGGVVAIAGRVAGERAAGEALTQGLTDVVDGIAVADVRAVDDVVTTARAAGGVVHAVGTACDIAGHEAFGLAGAVVEVVAFALLSAFDETVAAGVTP